MLRTELEILCVMPVCLSGTRVSSANRCCSLPACATPRGVTAIQRCCAPSPPSWRLVPPRPPQSASLPSHLAPPQSAARLQPPSKRSPLSWQAQALRGYVGIRVCVTLAVRAIRVRVRRGRLEACTCYSRCPIKDHILQARSSRRSSSYGSS